MLGGHPRIDADLRHSGRQAGVVDLFKIAAGQHLAAVLHDPQFAADCGCGCAMVAGDHDGFDSGQLAALDRLARFRARRILHRHQPDQGHLALDLSAVVQVV